MSNNAVIVTFIICAALVIIAYIGKDKGEKRGLNTKIKVIAVPSAKISLGVAIDIWTAIANSPDGTKENDVVEEGYSCNCPLCEYYGNTCNNCLINFCGGNDAPYEIWYRNKTAANAQAVLDQLIEAKEKL